MQLPSLRDLDGSWRSTPLHPLSLYLWVGLYTIFIVYLAMNLIFVCL